MLTADRKLRGPSRYFLAVFVIEFVRICLSMNPTFVVHTVFMFDWEGKAFIMLILGQFVTEALSFVSLTPGYHQWTFHSKPINMTYLSRLKRSASSGSEALAPKSMRDEIIWSLYAGPDRSLD